MLRFNRHQEKIQELLQHLNVEQGLTDKEIAKKAGVCAVTVGNWRHRLGIAPVKKFERHFRVKYGETAIEDFRRFLETGYSYAFIARGYGFTRERARQIAHEHFKEVLRGTSGTGK